MEAVFYKRTTASYRGWNGKRPFFDGYGELHPEINYVGVEMYDSVLLRALQKRERMEADGEKLDNLKFMCIDARILPDIFEKGEVQRIYLNFLIRGQRHVMQKED